MSSCRNEERVWIFAQITPSGRFGQFVFVTDLVQEASRA